MTVLNIPDPDHKINIVSQYWNDEAAQRNYGTWYLHKCKIDWAIEIDDDELYNTNDLKKVFEFLNVNDFSAYLIAHQIYWKNRNTILDHNQMSFPTIISTIPNRVYFDFGRTISVYEGKNWFTFDPKTLICHHMSYVRSDEKMFRKIKTFSHANDIVESWYDNVWLKWTEDMKNLHPTNPTEFRIAMKADRSSHKLDDINTRAISNIDIFES